MRGALVCGFLLKGSKKPRGGSVGAWRGGFSLRMKKALMPGEPFLSLFLRPRSPSLWSRSIE